MNASAQLIKTAMEQELKKEGKTLADLEIVLSKQAAPNWLIDPSKILDLGKGVASATGAATLTLGALGASGLYGMYRANEASNDLQMKKINEKKQYLDAARALQEDMQNPLTL